jgi:hypothetical protein
MGALPLFRLSHTFDYQLIENWYAGWHILIKSDVMKKFTYNPITFLFATALCLLTNIISATPIPAPAAATHTVAAAHLSKAAALRAEKRMILATATSIYEEMSLEDSGLNRKAFECAWTGYYKLKKKGMLRRTNILSIADFSQSSSSQRLYVIDVRNRRLLYRTYVAHGINSGQEYANAFSNKMESCKSSLGFYITTSTYYGFNGLSLRIEGLDKGFNDNAARRAIVIHGATYVSERILHKYGVMGTTFGCPAIPDEMTTQIIPVVKGGTCFFIYYPSNKYLAQSAVLNS